MTVHLLGTGSADSDAARTTTMLALEHDGAFFLVDCGGDAAHRMLASGLDPTALEAVVLTHAHPDHIGGFPLLIEKLWLLGRRAPVPVFGPAPALDAARALFDVFDTRGWTGLPDRVYHEVALDPGTEVPVGGPFRVTAARVDHPLPTIGLRVEAGGTTVAYPCDTAPCPAAIDLARNADLLVHEASGAIPHVHSSAEEAAHVARAAGARRLVLVHLPSDVDLADAREAFAETTLGRDGDRIEVG